MRTDTRVYANGTSVTMSRPWGVFVTAKVQCPDGKVRTVKRIAQTADTFFSVPAAVTVRGVTVSGFVSFRTQDDDQQVVEFVPYANRKNAHAFNA